MDLNFGCALELPRELLKSWHPGVYSRPIKCLQLGLDSNFQFASNTGNRALRGKVSFPR